jgi:hypothetical protein
MPLLLRRSYDLSDFHRFVRRPRARPLGFEAFIYVRPRSSGPVIHLAEGRSPLRISSTISFPISCAISFPLPRCRGRGRIAA